jgi:phage tail sheath protein FI
MPPSPDIRPPGVYHEAAERGHVPIALPRSGIVGFVGLAERGPTGVPVAITSLAQFHEVFGDLPEGGFLGPAVAGFFRNGGRECRVVRVAHHTGRSFGDFAMPATLRVPDRGGNPRLEVRAASEGQWGNAVRVTVRRQPPRAQTFLTLDAPAGATEATIRSTHGFRPGTLVRLFDETTEHHRFLVDVAGKTLRWADDAPLPATLSASAPTYVETVEFELAAIAPFASERIPDLSMSPASPAYVERVVADRSRLVRVRVLPSGSAPPLDIPVDLDDGRLAGGQDGLHNVTPDDFIGMSAGPNERTGLAALEAVEEIDLVAAPDVLWVFSRNQGREGLPFSTLKDVEVVHDALVSMCERTSDRFALLDSPFPDSPDRTREYRLLFDTRFAALYFPWLVVPGRDGPVRVPPCGHVAGVVARCDDAMGVHRAPANEPILGADDLSLGLREEDLGYLNAEGIDCLRSMPGRGLRVWGARAMTSDPQFRFLNVRRTMNAINKAMNTHLQWVVFEPNVPSLWKTVTRNVTQFLMELWRKGYFTGQVPEEAFFVRCDEENNTREERDAGRMIVDVGVAPVRPAEFVVLRVAQEMQETGTGER